MIKTTDDIKKLGTILGIWAHPDDETFTMGGIMAAAAKNGQQVICVTATKGEKGVQDESRWPAARMAEIRANELNACLEILGVKDHNFLDYHDGECAQANSEEAISALTGLINQYQPDSIFTFGSDGLTGHPDHCTVSDWAKKAAQKSGSKAVVYNVVQTTEQHQAMRELNAEFRVFLDANKLPVLEPGECAVCFELNDDFFDQKMAALKAHISQYDALFKLERSLRAPFGTEAFVEASSF